MTYSISRELMDQEEKALSDASDELRQLAKKETLEDAATAKRGDSGGQEITSSLKPRYINTRVSYPESVKYRGYVDIVSFPVQYSDLEGVFLDYVLAGLYSEYNAVTLEFSINLKPNRVLVGNTYQKMHKWSPTQNADQARDVIERFGLGGVGSSEMRVDRLRAIVREKFGDTILLLRPEVVS